jgi:hypothetical protein
VLSFTLQRRNFEGLRVSRHPYAAPQEVFVNPVRKLSLGRVLVAALAASILAVTAPGLARASTAKGGDRVRAFVPQSLLDAAAANRKGSFPVIVTGATGKTAQKLARDEIRQSGGADVTRSFRVIDAIAVELEGHQILWLAKKNTIRSIVPDAPVVATGFEPVELWPSVVGVDRLWETPGEGGSAQPGPQAPAIAVVDSGVDASRVDDFGARVRTAVDFVGG